MTMIKKDGHWVTVAGGQRMWVGTKAQLDAALATGELEDGTAVMVTDDYEDDSKVKPVAGYSTPGKDSGYETVTRTGNVVMIDFTTFNAIDNKVITGLPKPVNMTHCTLFNAEIASCTIAYITTNGEVFVESLEVPLYGQLVYFTNEA